MSNDDPQTGEQPVTVPDDLSSFTGAPRWSTTIRVSLVNGADLLGDGSVYEHEPHLGDIMDSDGQKVLAMLKFAKETGAMRFVPVDNGLAFVPYENIKTVFVDLLNPAGDMVEAEDIKPGFWERDGKIEQ